MPKIINGIKCRTREESLKRIIRQAKAKKIGPKDDELGDADNCQYQYPSGNNCAVGCLFSAKQLKDIEKQALNSMTIGYLAGWIGKDNVEAVTGMNLLELRDIQTMHDTTLEKFDAQTARERLIEYCQRELKLANV